MLILFGDCDCDCDDCGYFEQPYCKARHPVPATAIRLSFNRDRHERTLITSPDTIDFARGTSILPAQGTT
jgi:hypothetical protein